MLERRETTISHLPGIELRNGCWADQVGTAPWQVVARVRLERIETARNKVLSIARMVVKQRATVGCLRYAVEELEEAEAFPNDGGPYEGNSGITPEHRR